MLKKNINLKLSKKNKYNKLKKIKKIIKYRLSISHDITNWNGILLNKIITKYLKVNDIVRLRFKNEALYVKILNKIRNIFTGIIFDPYMQPSCDICNEFEICMEKECSCNICKNEKMCKYKDNIVYSCSSCRFDKSCISTHLKCFDNNKDYKKCDCILVKYKLHNYTKVYFTKNNISEIPHWTSNTSLLINKYKNKDNIGYGITGYR